MQLKRGEKALNDYLGGAEMMYKAYWPLMPLRRGFTPGKGIADRKWRQLFLFHDNRVPRSNYPLPCCQHHHAARGQQICIHAGIKAKPESFAAFKKEVASPSFKEELEKARDNPKSREAGKLIQRLMIFICMSGVKIPWSPEKRKREMSYII